MAKPSSVERRPAPESQRRACPRCASPRVAPIMYGYPSDMEGALKAAEQGEVVLGGCVITGNDPKWQCLECKHVWGRRAN